MPLNAPQAGARLCFKCTLQLYQYRGFGPGMSVGVWGDRVSRPGLGGFYKRRPGRPGPPGRAPHASWGQGQLAWGLMIFKMPGRGGHPPGQRALRVVAARGRERPGSQGRIRGALRVAADSF